MDRLQPPQQLNVGDELRSEPNGWVRLVMQGDGNLVLYRIQNGAPLWASNTDGQGAVFAAMQGDGNFVLYTPAGVPRWASNTDGNPGAWVVLQDDGNLVVYASGGDPLWASNTVQNWDTPTIQYSDARGYDFVATSERWKQICSALPCFAALQWPGYSTVYFDDSINGQPVVIQLWKGWCQKFLGLPYMPGGFGAEVGVYRRIPGKVRPTSLPFLPPALEAFYLNAIAPIPDNELWWPVLDLDARLQMTVINPVTNQTFFSAGPEDSYWLAHWMNEYSYAKYVWDQGARVPTFPNDFILEYTINGLTRRWPSNGVAQRAPGRGHIGVTTRRQNNIDIALSDLSGAVRTAAWEPGFVDGWHGWWPVGNVQAPAGAPVHVVSRSRDKLDIFVTDNAGVVRSAAWEPAFADGWHGWWEIRGGRAAPGAPVTAVSRGPDQLDIFVVGTDGRVWTAAWEPGFVDGWHGWWPVGA